MRFIKIAWRNVFRNKRRSSLVLITIASGIGIFIILNSITAGFISDALTNTIETQTAHLQIHSEGYEEKLDFLPLDIAIRDYQELEDELMKVPEVKAVTSRIEFGGLLAKDDLSIDLLGVAIQPEDEMRVVERLRNSIKEGSFLKEGEDGVLITEDTAKQIEAELGDKLIILAPTSYGDLGAIEVELVGFFDTGLITQDNSMMIIALGSAKRLLDMEGQITEMMIMHQDDEESERVAEIIRAGLKNKGLEINTWQHYSQWLLDILNITYLFIGILAFIIIVVASTGIINTMLMTIFERTREIGMMMSLGMRRATVMILFLIEALLLGALGSVIGCILGGSVSWYLSRNPISIAASEVETASEFGIGQQLYAIFSTSDITLAFFIGVIIATLGALYPAYRASKVEPIEALRFV